MKSLINFIMYKIFRRTYWRLNAILGFILLNSFSLLEAIFTKNSYAEYYEENMVVIKNSWNKY